jgi:hypothetical protein
VQRRKIVGGRSSPAMTREVRVTSPKVDLCGWD